MGRIIVGVNIGGLPEVKAAYEDFKDQYINRLVKSGAQKAGRKTVKPVKGTTKPHHRTGALEKARGMKYKSYKRGTTWVVLVGARHGFKETLPFWGAVDPTKYDHLLEGGRKAVRAGTKTRRSRNGKVTQTPTGKDVLAIKFKITPKPRMKGRLRKRGIMKQVKRAVRKKYGKGVKLGGRLKKVLGGYIVFATFAKGFKGTKPVAKNEPFFAVAAEQSVVQELQTGIPKILAKYGNKVYK